MNEVKSPKKPLLYYYFVAMLLVMLFNFIAMPWISEHQIKDVDYNTFVTMTEQGEVGRVEIQEQSNRILFTSSDEKTVYKTAMVPDDGLVQRLLDAGVSTTGEEIEQTSTLVSILAWVLPIIIFVALGQYMSRKMMEKMGGGGNSMMFNMGKSNAKVYLELLRRGYEVTVGRTGDKEIDFVCDKRGEKLYVQVCYLLASDETVNREFGAYDAIRDNFPKYVVSLDEFDMSRNGIKHRNIRDFLLAEEWN